MTMPKWSPISLTMERKIVTNINSVAQIVRGYANDGLDIDNITGIAQMALKESYNCENSYHATLMYLMALDILSTCDDGK